MPSYSSAETEPWIQPAYILLMAFLHSEEGGGGIFEITSTTERERGGTRMVPKGSRIDKFV